MQSYIFFSGLLETVKDVKDDGHMLKNCQTVVDNDGYTTGLNEKLTLFIGSFICL